MAPTLLKDTADTPDEGCLQISESRPVETFSDMHPLAAAGFIAGLVYWLFSKDKESKMPAVQRQFEDFHSAICFDEDDEKATLREKRDTIVKALKDNLPDDVPSFVNFNQGS